MPRPLAQLLGAHPGPHRGVVFGAAVARCALAALLLVGCTKSCSEHEAPPQKTEAPSATASSPVSQEAPDSTAAALSQIVAACRFNEEHALITRCTEHEQRLLVRELRNGKRDRVGALPDLLAALQSADPKRRIAAARIAHGGLRQGLGTVAEGAVAASLAADWLKTLGELPPKLARPVIGPAVHIAMAAGQAPVLYAFLDQHPDQQLRATAYAQIATHGGLAVLPKLRELLAQEDAALAGAAMQSARLLPHPAGGEVCVLALGHLADNRPLVALRAGQIAATCGAAGIDALLSDLELRRRDHRLHVGYPRTIQYLCGTKESPGSDAQCKRLKALLRAVAPERKHGADIRAATLIELATQFPEPETLALVEPLQEDDNPRVRSYARKALAILQRSKADSDAQTAATSGKAVATPTAPKDL